MSENNSAPQGNPGDILNWPMLKVVYRTDPEAIAAVLPPGIEPGADPHVNLTFYNVPVPDEPEFGILQTVNADYNGLAGEYALGYGIDQESAIFISRDHNGQPKYPCDTDYFRLGPNVSARSHHQGYTFAEFRGTATGENDPLPEFDMHEWWVKFSLAAGVMPDPANGYDFPPHVVHVRSRYGTNWRERVDGELILRDSPWDPLASRLPLREQVSAHLWWPEFLDREVKLAGKLDPEAFKPFTDTISGSRWPGTRGGPRR